MAKYRPTRVGQTGAIGDSGSAADNRVNEMRYLENKERSTEILRLALPLMARQLAAFHPLSYALWYEHCAGMNPDLSRVLDSRLSSNTALTEADVWRLYAQHIAARDMEAFERLQLQLRNLLEDTAHSAATASHQAAEFGHSLQGHAKVLADPQGPEKIREIVADMLVGTQKMQHVTVGPVDEAAGPDQRGQRPHRKPAPRAERGAARFSDRSQESQGPGARSGGSAARAAGAARLRAVAG